MSWTTMQQVRLPLTVVPMSEARAYNTSGLYKKQADLPPLKGLSFLDRFLVLWILIAMGVGIAIGNTVDNAGPALQRGEFVGVSIPIGM
jgi:ACR3 family arsenite transporter